MWKCTHCPEQLEDDFDICWNCGYARDGSPPENRQVNRTLPNEKQTSHLSKSHNDSPQQKIQGVEANQVNETLPNDKWTSHISISDNDSPISISDSDSTPQKIQQVVVVDVNMPFWSMVAFIVQWTIASIPAVIILIIIFYYIISILQKIF